MGVFKPIAATVVGALLMFTAGCDQKTVKSPVARNSHATAPTLAANAPSRPALAAEAAQTGMSPGNAVEARNQARAVIDIAELRYQSGVREYRAGDLPAAKRDFDAAVDAMLTSGLDLKGDSQLSGEFERIVDAVNTIEMDALKQGNGFVPKSEESPVDVANDVTFPVDPNIRATAEAELKTTQSDLPLVINDAVASYIGYFSNNPKGHYTIVNSLRRAGRYKDMIQRILAQEGVPRDLIYQAIAESGFQVQAVNGRSGAAGMWQFMPFSGAYGLERNAWIDERFDPEKATHAYAREIKKMYSQLGDWYLAMAAYDWGPGNVQRAVQRTGYADFWELYKRNNLPQETKNYVPIILAAAIMAKNPTHYGLSDLRPDPPVLTDTVTTNGAVDLRLVSDIVGASVQELGDLNPSLLRMSTPPDTAYDLHLPAGTRDLYTRAIAEIPDDKRTTWRYHRVQPGDTLDSIARAYHVSVPDLAFTNQIPSRDANGSAPLENQEALVIPVASVSLAGAARHSRYRSVRGDTLVTVADRFDVTTAQLRRWNHLRSNAIPVGKVLYVAEPAHISAAGRGGSRRAGARRTTRATAGESRRTAGSRKSAAPHRANEKSAKRSTVAAAHATSIAQ